MRPRLLFLSHTLPIPEGGASIRSYNILRILARSYDITVLSFYRKDARPETRNVARGLDQVRTFAEVEVFPIAQEFNRARFVADHARSVLHTRAYTRYVYASDEYAARVRAHVASGRYALAHVDSLDLVAYLQLLEGLPAACTHQNVESRLLRRRAQATTSPAKRGYLTYQARLLESEEREWCARVDTNFVVSADDGEELRRVAPGARVVVAPNGVDTDFFQPDYTAEAGLVFIGPASWGPNEDAMRFLGADILPRLRKLGTDVEATWVGRAPDSLQREFRREFGIRMTGYVDDVRPYISTAACYVVPLRTGGGTRLKILEAWAMGKAVVSTSVGCEGLAAEDDGNILIRDDATEFAAAVRELLNDEQLRQRLGRAARDTAVRHYDWEVIGRTMVDEYASLAATEVSLA